MNLEKLLATANRRGVSNDNFQKKLQDKYIELIRAKRLDDLTSLIEITKIPINAPDEVIQGIFLNYIKEDSFYELRQLTLLCNVNPGNNVIQEGYDNFFAKGDYSKAVERVERLNEVTKVMPSEEVMQKGYKVFAKAIMFYELNALKSFSGINPSEEVQKIVYSAVSDFLIDGKNPYYHLQNFITSPTNANLKMVLNLISKTGVVPLPDAIQRVYLRLIDTGNFTEIPYFENVVRVKPLRETIQFGYKKIFEGGKWNFAEDLMQKFGAPSEELVQEFYALFAQNEKFSQIERLKEFSHIEPNEAAYDKLLDGLEPKPKEASHSTGGNSGDYV